MPKQHHPSNEISDGGPNHPSSNHDAGPHDTPRTDDDVIMLTPINQKQPAVPQPKQPVVSKPKQPSVTKPNQPTVTKPKQPTVTSQKQPVVSKPKQPTVTQPKQPAVTKPKQQVVSKPKQPSVKKQNTNSNSSYKTPPKQPHLPEQLAARQVSRNERHVKYVSSIQTQSNLLFLLAILGIFLTALVCFYVIPKDDSHTRFQKEWNKLQREEAAGITSVNNQPEKEKTTAEKAGVVAKSQETTKKQKAEEAAVETKEKAVEKTADVDSAEASTEHAVESTSGDAIESSVEDSETEDDNDDLVMDFLKKRVGTVTGRLSSQGTRRIRRPPNPVLQQYVPRGSWSPGNLSSHWAKHGHEFPEYGSEEEYGKGALYFFEHPPPGTLRKTRGNGDRLYYYPRTNTFGVTTADGTPKTMFRPDRGMDYWNRQ